MTAGSLRLRLMVAGAAAIVLALAVAGAGLALLFDRHVQRSLSEDLDVYLRQLASGVDIAPDGQIVVNRPPADPRFADPLSGLYWQAGDDAGATVRSRSLWDTVLDLPRDGPGRGEAHRHELPGPAGARVLVVERRVQIAGSGSPRWIRLAVAATLDRAAVARRAFTADLAAALGLLALVLVLAAWAQIQLGLRPLDAVRRGVAEIRSGRDRRLGAAVPAEVRPLVDEVNALLDAQDREIVRARDRAADLAHGLKTPLSALAADVRRLQAAGQPAIAGDIDALAQTMRRHIDRELVRTRPRTGAAVAAPVTRVLPVAEALVRTLSRTPRGESIRFEIQIPPQTILPFDHADVADVLGNLMENAARHARSRVRIDAAAGQPGAVAVEDDGPGVAPEDAKRILKRGARLDRGGSAGLGLAIVQDVLDAYGWHLNLGRSGLGGLAAVLGPGSPLASTESHGRKEASDPRR